MKGRGGRRPRAAAAPFQVRRHSRSHLPLLSSSNDSTFALADPSNFGWLAFGSLSSSLGF